MKRSKIGAWITIHVAVVPEPRLAMHLLWRGPFTGSKVRGDWAWFPSEGRRCDLSEVLEIVVDLTLWS